jgi:hypothetical protein
MDSKSARAGLHAPAPPFQTMERIRDQPFKLPGASLSSWRTSWGRLPCNSLQHQKCVSVRFYAFPASCANCAYLPHLYRVSACSCCCRARVNWISKPPHSATLPPLHLKPPRKCHILGQSQDRSGRPDLRAYAARLFAQCSGQCSARLRAARPSPQRSPPRGCLSCMIDRIDLESRFPGRW